MTETGAVGNRPGVARGADYTVSIEISNESGVEVDTDAICQVARHALSEMGVHPLADLSILVVDESYMAELKPPLDGFEGSHRRAVVPDGRTVGRSWSVH